MYYKSFEECINDYSFENDIEQYDLLQELLDGIETMDCDEFEEKRDRLCKEAREIVDKHVEKFCDNTIGDDSWKNGWDWE